MKKLIIGLASLGVILFGISFIPDGNGPLFQPSGLNSSFDFKGGTFQEYLAYTRNVIKTAREKTDGADSSEEVVAGNASTEIIPANVIPGKEKQYKDLVILIHSLTGSPYDMRELANFYASRGMVVRNIVLPGHGTIPGDTVEVQYEDWDAAVEFVIQDSLKAADNVHMVGFSTGGGFSVLKAYKYPIKSVMLFAPMIKIHSSLAPLLPIVSKVGRVIKKLRWETLEPETHPFRYESMTYSIGAQVYALQNELAEKIKTPLKQPIFAALSLDDTTVNPLATITYFTKNASDNSRMILYTRVKQKFKDSRIKQQDFSGFADNINSASHVAIVTKIDDPYYGLDGKFKICARYVHDPEKFKKCETLPHSKVIYGEGGIKEDDPDKIYRRITFNPYFDQMIADLGKFLDSLN